MSRKTIGGFVCVRNGDDLDYCWREASTSLLKIVDELVLCDSDSTDGTSEAMQRMADTDSRITVINWPWPAPKGESHNWFIEWLNFARSHLKSDYCIYLDADEILSDEPDCHAALREAAEQDKCLTVDRLNFWRDAKHLIPDGHCCGKWCTRFGRTEYICVSDEPRHAGEREIVDRAIKEPRVHIFHLGFLREKKAFYRKARVVLEGWFNRFDPRLEEGEKENKPVWETECSFSDQLVPFDGYLPDAAQLWLSERGHATPAYLARLERDADPLINVRSNTGGDAPLRVLHSGDFGDIIFGLAVLRSLNRPIDLFLVDRPITKPIVRRKDALIPLLLAQPYIESVKVYEGEPIDWNASDFRTMYERTSNLVEAHLQHYLGQHHLSPVKVDSGLPWLTVPPVPSNGRVVINRTPRYHNYTFPWQKIRDHYGKVVLFVGSADEHAAFETDFGPVDYIATDNLLEVAQIIAGSELFIGNQSCAFAIAEALKHPRIQSACLDRPDCLFSTAKEYPAGKYVSEGYVELPAVGTRPSTVIPSNAPVFKAMDIMRVPPGSWQYPNMRSSPSIHALAIEVSKMNGVSIPQAKEMIYEFNCNRLPDFFRAETPHLDRFNKALKKVS